MKLTHRPLAALVVCAALALASHASAADAAKTLVPADVDAVVSVNVNTVIGSEAFKQVLAVHGTEQVHAQLDAFKNLTGVDVLGGDLQRVTLFGRFSGSEGGALLLEGRFDQERLLGLLKAGGTHGTVDVGGHTVHTWFDDEEDEERYGCFVDASTILVAEEVEAIAACLSDSPRAFANPENAKLLPANSSGPAAWCVIFDASRLPNDGDIQGFDQLRSVSASLTLGPSAAVLDAQVNLASAEQMQTWLDLARGFLALGQLQGDNPGLAELARRCRIEAGKDCVCIVVGLEVTYDLLRQLHERDQQDSSDGHARRAERRRERREARRDN